MVESTLMAPIPHGIVYKEGMVGKAKDPLSRTVTCPESGCWLFRGGLNAYGYGVMRHNGQRNVMVHRVMYERFKGPIPDGIFVCHTCDIRNCVNPDHLFLGTPAENSRDAVNKQRTAAGTDNPSSKLSEDQVIEIYVSPLPSRELAEIYGVRSTVIQKIKADQIWQRVTAKSGKTAFRRNRGGQPKY